ncbi:MAG: hypothetical protein IPM06_19575 [Rhizobiales bacterium]|nr:hypothetical protein [Hyphomicrobiales bacterium]
MSIGMIGEVSSRKSKQWAKPAPQNSVWSTAIETAKRTNVIDLAGRYVELRRASGSEMQGPCPKCGGEDRLHVKKDGWFCRNCHPIDAGGHGWHDAIEFVTFTTGMDFASAVTDLTGASRTFLQTSDNQDARRPAPPPPSPQTDEWRERCAPIVEAAQVTLLADDNPGSRYLAERGLMTPTWQAFGFGFGSHREQPAIVIPWYRAGKLQAIRYRFIAPTDGPKIISEPGSKFAGAMYGGQALLGCAEDLRTLVICEGEINAASIWQVHHLAALDVLSLGSESATLPTSIPAFAAKFRTVIVWMDKPDIARKLAEQLTGATAVSSPVLPNAPKGMDANDMLRIGKLSAYLSAVRERACKNDAEREALRWDLVDGGAR